MRIFKPATDNGSSNQFVLWLSRSEILIGSGLLVVGGFYSRVTGDYLMVSVGSVLLLLGCWHLYRDVKPPVSERPYETDRMYLILEEQLPKGYSLAFDVPVGDDLLDYLVVGDGGVFAIRRLDVRGEVSGARDSDTWQIDPPNDGEVRTVRNPLTDNDTVVREIRQQLDEQMDTAPPVYGLVVVTGGTVNVDVPEDDAPRRMGEVGAFILDREDEAPLELDRQKSVERVLQLPSY